MSESTPAIVHLADDAHEALRELAHLTLRGAIPAPVLYEVLGRLAQIGPTLDQTLRQLGDGLLDSLSVYEVAQDDSADPIASVAACRDALTTAARQAAHLGRHLESAQQAIARQGYTVRE